MSNHLSAADIAELRNADAALPPGPWFPRLNDLIGGWCVMAVDSPPSEAHPTDMIADFTSDHAAAHIARMRNHLAALLDAAEKAARRERIENHLTFGACFRNPQGIELTIVEQIGTTDGYPVLGGGLWMGRYPDPLFGSQTVMVTVDGLVSCGYEPIEEADTDE